MSENRLSSSSRSLTVDDLSEVEAIVGPLPPELRALYMANNGGQPERRHCMSPDGRELQFRGFRPMKCRRFDGDVLLEETYLRVVRDKRILPENLVPFGDNDGGDLYCVDRESGAVHFRPMDGEKPSPRTLTPVAPTIEAFLDGMQDEDTFYG